MTEFFHHLVLRMLSINFLVSNDDIPFPSILGLGSVHYNVEDSMKTGEGDGR